MRAAAVLLLLGLAHAIDGKAPPPLDGEHPRLVEDATKTIREALAGKPTRRAADKARVAALLVAASAQRNLAGPDSRQRASLRDAALALADLVKAEDFTKARQRVEALAGLKADPNAKKEKVKLLGPWLDVEDVMMQFRSVKVGGLGLEAKFDRLAALADGTIPASELNAQLLLDAYRTALSAVLTAEHSPKAKAREWRDLAQAMERQALALGAAIQTKDGKTSFAALGRLNRTCNQCHQAFRNQ